MARRQRLTDDQWRTHIAEQRASGLSVEAYCRECGLAASTFYLRQRRLRGAIQAAFVEVTMAPGAPGVPGPPGAAGSSAAVTATAADAYGDDPAAIELRLACGVIVRVRTGFDAVTLRRVVEALS